MRSDTIAVAFCALSSLLATGARESRNGTLLYKHCGPAGENWEAVFADEAFMSFARTPDPDPEHKPLLAALLGAAPVSRGPRDGSGVPASARFGPMSLHGINPASMGHQWDIFVLRGDILQLAKLLSRLTAGAGPTHQPGQVLRQMRRKAICRVLNQLRH